MPLSTTLINALPAIQDLLYRDAEFIFQGDPAASSIDEVIAAYPGFNAILFYRLANICWTANYHVFARALSAFAQRLSGVDIHPAAKISSPFFIDHGTGIVIGETTQIGSSVKLYQGVTLGALSVEKELAQTKRHPTIMDNVVVYANATILGGETVIGSGSIIGGNVWLTQSVPENSRVYHRGDLTIK